MPTNAGPSAEQRNEAQSACTGAGHDAHLTGSFEKLCARLVVFVARLDRCDEHARIYDETQSSGS